MRLNQQNGREGGLAKDARNAGGNLEEGEMRHALSPESDSAVCWRRLQKRSSVGLTHSVCHSRWCTQRASRWFQSATHSRYWRAPRARGGKKREWAESAFFTALIARPPVYPSRGRSNFNPPFDPVTALSHIEIVIDFAEYTSLARSPFHLGLVGRVQQ